MLAYRRSVGIADYNHWPYCWLGLLSNDCREHYSAPLRSSWVPCWNCALISQVLQALLPRTGICDWGSPKPLANKVQKPLPEGRTDFCLRVPHGIVLRLDLP